MAYGRGGLTHGQSPRVHPCFACTYAVVCVFTCTYIYILWYVENSSKCLSTSQSSLASLHNLSTSSSTPPRASAVHVHVHVHGFTHTRSRGTCSGARVGVRGNSTQEGASTKLPLDSALPSEAVAWTSATPLARRAAHEVMVPCQRGAPRKSELVSSCRSQQEARSREMGRDENGYGSTETEGECAGLER